MGNQLLYYNGEPKLQPCTVYAGRIIKVELNLGWHTQRVMAEVSSTSILEQGDDQKPDIRLGVDR